MNSPLTSINTNYSLLASSSSTSITWTDSTSDTNVKAAMAADATSGKKKLYKNIIYNEFLHMHLDILKKKWKEMSKNIVLTY